MQLYYFVKEFTDSYPISDELVAMLRNEEHRLDLGHQEMTLLILSKSRNQEAHSFMADFLQSENVSLRFIATKNIAELPEANEFIMEKIVEALVERRDKFQRDELDGILKRPSNTQAKIIADSFLRPDLGSVP